MSVHELVLPTLGRWLGLLAMAVLVGCLVVDVWVLPRDAAKLDTERGRLRRWIVGAVGVLIITSAGDLTSRARVMTGGDLSQAFAALPLVLTRTHFGAIWIARMVLLAVLVAVSFAVSLSGRMAALGLSLAVVATGSLTGHAADLGDLSWAVLIDWLHGVAATAWTGGLFALVLAIRLRDWPPELVALVARRFSRLAGYCLLVVVASGVYNACVQLPGFPALWTTTYGGTLLLKIGLALVLALLGAINRFRVLPDLAVTGAPAVGRRGRAEPAFGGAPAHATARLSRLIAWEAALAIAVFAGTAVLGESTPKSHESHASHAPAYETNRPGPSARRLY